MNRTPQKGIALILTLIIVFVMSVMAVSLMFISQTETWSSMNYRLMSQARDGAEAGINSAANYIVNTYTSPGGAGDPTTAYNVKVSPVQSPSTATSGDDVILTTISGHTSNYPVNSVTTAFNTTGVGKGSITAGNLTINYNTEATLLSMHTAFTPFGTVTPQTVQTWKIVSDGSVSTIRNAKVEVSAILEQHITPTFNYAAYATNNGCSALTFGGGGTTNSYDSSTYSGTGTPTFSTADGNVGTNGNLNTLGASTTINGDLFTPRAGTGACSVSNVTAWTDSSGTINGSIVELPQAINYPTPALPNPMPGTTSTTLNNKATDCGTINGCTYGSPVAGDFYLAPGTCPPAVGGPGVYDNITIKGTVHLSTAALGTKACYNINSLTENGQGTLAIDSGPVILNLAGVGTSTPLDITGGGMINSVAPAYNPMSLQILYAGSGTIKLKGGGQSIGVMYAPNASYSIGGGADWYGSLIGGTLTDMGGSAIHYDRHLANAGFTVGNWMLDSFTWKKY
jgi:PilX N-terminal